MPTRWTCTAVPKQRLKAGTRTHRLFMTPVQTNTDSCPKSVTTMTRVQEMSLILKRRHVSTPHSIRRQGVRNISPFACRNPRLCFRGPCRKAVFTVVRVFQRVCSIRRQRISAHTLSPMFSKDLPMRRRMCARFPAPFLSVLWIAPGLKANPRLPQ